MNCYCNFCRRSLDDLPVVEDKNGKKRFIRCPICREYWVKKSTIVKKLNSEGLYVKVACEENVPLGKCLESIDA